MINVEKTNNQTNPFPRLHRRLESKTIIKIERVSGKTLLQEHPVDMMRRSLLSKLLLERRKRVVDERATWKWLEIVLGYSSHRREIFIIFSSLQIPNWNDFAIQFPRIRRAKEIGWRSGKCWECCEACWEARLTIWVLATSILSEQRRILGEI